MCSFISPDLGLHCSQVPRPNLAPFSYPLAAPRGIHNLFHPESRYSPGFQVNLPHPLHLHTPCPVKPRLGLAQPSSASAHPHPQPRILEALSPASCPFHEGYECVKPLGIVSPGPPSLTWSRPSCLHGKEKVKPSGRLCPLRPCFCWKSTMQSTMWSKS